MYFNTYTLHILIYYVYFFADTPVFHFGSFDFADPTNYASDYDSDASTVTVYSPTTPAHSRKRIALVFETPNPFTVDTVIEGTRGYLNYIGLNTLRAVSKRHHSFQRTAIHYFQNNSHNSAYPQLFPKSLCEDLVTDWNMGQMIDCAVGTVVTQVPEDQVDKSWLYCAISADLFNMNKSKDGRNGYQFDHVPHNLYHPLPQIERNHLDIWAMRRASQHMTCFNCGFLTCCGGPTNKENYIDEFQVSHKPACPFLNALRSMTLDQLRDMGVTVPENNPNMRRSYYRSFMKLREFSRHIRNAVNNDLYSTTIAIQTMWLANSIRFQLHFRGENPGPHPDDVLEPLIGDWGDNEHDNHNPTARFRFGLKRLCTPCMNPQCSFFGNCTIKRHYCTRAQFTDSDTMFKHVGAVPLDHFPL